jgi:formylglycine-generating enzyme required for sulfatase activity
MHIFISYAKRDTGALARQLRDGLAALPGVTAWMDESIEVGGSWPQQIQREIDRCDLVIVLLSPDIHRDPASPEGPSFVLKELNYALYEVHKPVLPVMARRTLKPLVLADVQHVDLNSDHSIEPVIEAVRRHLEEPTGTLMNKKRTTQVTPVEVALPRDFPLQPPFEWCNVPAGYVVIEDASPRGGTKGGRYWVEAFAMGKYPITNAQYDVFVDDRDGYVNSGWWGFSEEAHAWRRAHTKPRGSAFEGHDLPCTNVSWYEAMAFCYWLAFKTGLDAVLPTEQQWQRAAQGDDSREYPWGETFDPSRCNHGNHVGRPTPVTRYATGASPFGVTDMSGNVWEWCLNEWGSDSARSGGGGMRVVRGGSWGFYQSLARAASRNWHDPGSWAVNQGFRIALAGPIPER